MKVITLTINPSIDKSTVVDHIVPDNKLRCASPIFQPGGGGINVSRAINKMGGTSLAVYLSGGATGHLLTQLLMDEGVKTRVIDQEDRTRENFIVVDASGEQYRFGMPGTEVTPSECEELENIIEGLDVDLEYLVLSGSLQSSVPADIYGKIARKAKLKGVKVVLDTVESALESALAEGVFLIKPNIKELFDLAGYTEIVPGRYVEIARELIDAGKTEVVVVSMGPKGASIITKDEFHEVVPPATECRSTVGAGDSMVGGIVLALSENRSFKKALQMGVAMGTAATMNVGTSLCAPTDVERILDFFEAKGL